jgi:hypothetical protein
MNPVTDGIDLWQADADSNDSNLPVDATNIGIGTVGDLTGELRRIKSEIRSLSLHMSWEKWLGVRNLAGTANVTFTSVPGQPTIFVVNDNFITSTRNVALIGRRVRGIQGSGSNVWGTITGATYFPAQNTTNVAVLLDFGAFDPTLQEVQFGVEQQSLNLGVLIPIGTKMLFRENTAPNGWQRIVDPYADDRMVRVVTGPVVDGGSWQITGLTSQGHLHGLGGHTHFIPAHQHDMQDHTHAGGLHTHAVTFTDNANVAGGGAIGVVGDDLAVVANTFPPSDGPIPNVTGMFGQTSNGPNTTSDVAGALGIISDAQWRPLQLDFILCQRII